MTAVTMTTNAANAVKPTLGKLRVVFKAKPFDWLETHRTFVMPSPSVRKEVRDRMCGTHPVGLDLVMRLIVHRYGAKWMTLKQIYDVAQLCGVYLSPFNPWVLYTCLLTFPRHVDLGDTPWGIYLPYFIMSGHSPIQEARFRVAPEFAAYATLPQPPSMAKK